MPVCLKCGRPVPVEPPGNLNAICPDCGPAAGSAQAEGEAANGPGGRRLRLRRPAVTFALIGVNVLVYLGMVLGGVSPMQPNSLQLIRWGADFGPLTLTGQWWRLLSSNYVHIGLVHLALNMWCLFDLGFLAENLYGRWTFLALYLCTGVGGSLASLVRNPLTVSAGASGAIFGVAGALISTLHFGDLPLARESLKTSLRSLLLFAGYNLVYGFLKGGIDNGAHLGGLASGPAAAAAPPPETGRAGAGAA